MLSVMFRSVLPLSTLALAFAAGCGASPSASVAQVPRGPESTTPAPAPIPPGEPSCANSPPAEAPSCTTDDAACAEAHRRHAKTWKEWTLRCEPVLPVNPIAGEHIEALLPYPPGGSGICTAGEMTVEKIIEGDVTVLRVDNQTHGNCDELGGLSGLSLGELPAGAYRIDTGYWSTEFTVRPTGSDPGDLPEAVRLASIVAMDRTPGQCFGMPTGLAHEGPFDDRGGFAKQRIGKQMKKAFPDRSYEELAQLFESATAISIAPQGSNAWKYAYRDGGCCVISEVEGTLVRKPDGTFAVGPAVVTSSENEPC